MYRQIALTARSRPPEVAAVRTMKLICAAAFESKAAAFDCSKQRSKQPQKWL